MLEIPVTTRTASARLGIFWYNDAMRATIDAMGRIVVPKPLRDALGLEPGTVVDISRYGEGLQLVPGGRTARLTTADDGLPVAESDTIITDDVILGLLDAGRK